MTALPAGLRPAGVAWAVLAAHRVALRIWLGFVALAVAGLVVLYVLGEEVNRTNPCSVGGGDLPPCAELDAVLPYYTTWMSIAAAAVAWLPLVVAPFVGGALVGREMESGTASLAWTQAVTPARWLAVRLAVPTALLVTGTSVLTALFHRVWTVGDENVLNEWFWADVFRATGPVTVAYVLLGLAVGVVAGLLARRALPALGIAAAVMLTVHFVADAKRFALWPTALWKGEQAASPPNSAYAVDWGLLAERGEGTDATLTRIEGFCDADSPPDMEACLSRHDAVDFYAVVHPASHYWPLQLVETGIVLAAAALLAAVSFRLLRKRLP